MENKNQGNTQEEKFGYPSHLNDSLGGMHEVSPEQREGMNDTLEEIGEHEEKIAAKLNKIDINTLSPETKKSLTILGRVKSFFATKTPEEKALEIQRKLEAKKLAERKKFEAKKPEYLKAVMEHRTARNIYTELLKSDPEKADLYLEAYSYYGNPLYWYEDEQRYGGSKPSIN